MGFLTVFRGLSEGKVQHTAQPLVNTIKRPPEYSLNLASFARWSEFHRGHQRDALDKIQGQVLGQINLPTGTGKTRVQVAVHVQEMIELLKSEKYGVFVTAAHRLALCTQLLEELIRVAVHAGIPFDILFVGSSRFADDKVHAKFKDRGFNRYVNEATSTTRGDEIAKAVFRSQSRKRHTIAVSTYHSFDRLAILPAIDVATYDEAHVTVGENFTDNINAVKPKIRRNFFFTATRKVQGETEGMNDRSMFGEILHEVGPRAMVEAGEIVPPRIHIIRTEDEGDFNNHSMLVKTVLTGFEQHRTLVKEVSSCPDEIGAKLLITTTGNKEMMELHNDQNFRDYCSQKSFKVFAYSSELGSFYNFKPHSRDECMTWMRELRDDEDAIMLHIDILTEGIDLPSITGVMPFRELNTLKLLQTLGRSARLLTEDRRRLYLGELTPMDWEGYVKPCCWLILPEFFKSLGNANAMRNAIFTIINSYGVPVEEYSVIDHYKADLLLDNKRITEVDQPRRKDKESNLIHIIEGVLLDKAWRDDNKSPLELIDEFFV